MDGSVVNRLDALDSGLSILKGDLSKVNRKVDANAVKIGEQSVSITTNKGNIAKLQSEIEKLKEAPAFPALPSPTNPWPTPTDARSGPDAAYLLARRSLRLWPISGTVTEKIWESTGEFLEVHLGLNDQISEPMIERIYRPDVPSGPGAKMEAVVVFRDPSTRDTVIGSSARLASHVDAAGRPTARIRLEVPPALWPTFSVRPKLSGPGMVPELAGISNSTTLTAPYT